MQGNILYYKNMVILLCAANSWHNGCMIGECAAS